MFICAKVVQKRNVKNYPTPKKNKLVKLIRDKNKIRCRYTPYSILPNISEVQKGKKLINLDFLFFTY